MRLVVAGATAAAVDYRLRIEGRKNGIPTAMFEALRKGRISAA